MPGQAAGELMRKGQELMPDGGKWCGIKQHNNKLPYTNTGLMKETESLGESAAHADGMGVRHGHRCMGVRARAGT